MRELIHSFPITPLLGLVLLLYTNLAFPINKEFKLFSTLYKVLIGVFMAIPYFVGLTNINFTFTGTLIAANLQIIILAFGIIAISAPVIWLIRGRESEQGIKREHILHFISNIVGCAIAICSIFLLKTLQISDLIVTNSNFLFTYEMVILYSALFLMFKAEADVEQQVNANKNNAIAPCLNAVWCTIAYFVFSLAFIHSLAYLLITREISLYLTILLIICIVYLSVFSYAAISNSQKLLLPAFALALVMGIGFILGILFALTSEISILSEYIELIMFGLILFTALLAQLYKDKIKGISIFNGWSIIVMLIFTFNFLLAAAVHNNVFIAE